MRAGQPDRHGIEGAIGMQGFFKIRVCHRVSLDQHDRPGQRAIERRCSLNESQWGVFDIETRDHDWGMPCARKGIAGNTQAIRIFIHRNDARQGG